jgi:hypothetical protein
VASTSPYRIVLTAQQRGELERRAREYAGRYCRVIRAKIVLMAADGLANNEIAARVDTSPQVVHRWRKRFFERGLDGLDDHPRSGRPPVFPPLGGHRGQAAGVRVAGDDGGSAVAVELRRVGSGADPAGRGRVHLGGDYLADLDR